MPADIPFKTGKLWLVNVWPSGLRPHLDRDRSLPGAMPPEWRIAAREVTPDTPGQKTYFSPNCMSRGATEVLPILPKLGVPTIVPGLPNCG
jgi:hypothetical protein